MDSSTDDMNSTINENNFTSQKGTSKSDSDPSTSNENLQMEKETTNGQAAMASSPQMMPNISAHKRNGGDIPTVTNNLANGTVTIVIERSKPLILKLRNPEYSFFGLGSAKKPEDDIDKVVAELGDDLVEYVRKTVYEIRDETKRARPEPEEDNYEVKMEAYRRLLALVTDMINRLTAMFTESLTEYRRLINQFWDKLQTAQNENEQEIYSQQFLKESLKNFRNAIKNNIEPLIESVENNLTSSQ